MAQMEPGAEQQVWQRVFAQPAETAREDLHSLLMAAAELAGAYRSLTTTLTGKNRERARQLYEGEMATLACLKGIGVLSRRGGEVLKVWNPSGEPVSKLLEKCYHRSRRCMVEYTARSMDSEFGTVFQKLAEREGKHCALLAELLGGKL